MPTWLRKFLRDISVIIDSPDAVLRPLLLYDGQASRLLSR
jgi:hypothetical protein